MTIDLLVPRPAQKRRFSRAHQKFVPDRPGCYVLTTFSDEVLYVGLAVDLRRRMGNHLDDGAKTSETVLGRAIWFYWLETDDLPRGERTWMNIHNLEEGRLPLLNSVYSPTAT